MTKNDFMNLDTKDMLDYINTELSNGKQFDQVRKEVGFGDRAWKTIREARGIIYNPKTKQYISTTETTTIATTEDLEGVVVESNTNTLLTIENANMLDYMTINKDVIIALVENYKSTTQTTTNYITIDLVDDKHLKPKPKSIRINEFIYQEWQEFCDKQHYSKMDLISMALKEYMEKYK